MGNPSQNFGTSPAIWDQWITQRRSWDLDVGRTCGVGLVCGEECPLVIRGRVWPTQVSATRLNLSQTGQYSIYLPRRDGRLSWPWYVDSWRCSWSCVCSRCSWRHRSSTRRLVSSALSLQSLASSSSADTSCDLSASLVYTRRPIQLSFAHAILNCIRAHFVEVATSIVLLGVCVNHIVKWYRLSSFNYKKFELMLTRCAKVYSSSDSIVWLKIGVFTLS